MEGYLLLLTLLSLCQSLIALCPMQPSSTSTMTASVRLLVPPVPPTETVPPIEAVPPIETVPPKPSVPPRPPTPPQIPDPGLLWPGIWYDYNYYKNSPYATYNSGIMQTVENYVQLSPGYADASFLKERDYPMPSMIRSTFEEDTKFYYENRYPMMQQFPMSGYPRGYEYLMDFTLLDVSNNNANINSNVNLNSNVEKIRKRSRRRSAS